MTVQDSLGLQDYAAHIARSLDAHSLDIFPPDAKKKLRRFAMPEAVRFLGINHNTFRHYLKIFEGQMPGGELSGGNRRSFSMEEIHEIRSFLHAQGKLSDDLWRRRRPGEALKVISVINMKGGVSKTSVTTTLAVTLASRGYRVLCIDKDAQGSMTGMFGLTPEADPNMLTVYDAIKSDNPVPFRDVIRPSFFPGIDIAPVSPEIVEFEYETALSFREGSTGVPFYARMAECLASVEDSYDIVLYDTPPYLTFAVISALFSSTGLIIPLTAGMLDMMSLSTFLSMTADIMQVVEREAGGKRFDFVRFLLTRFESTDQPQVQVASFLRTILGNAVMTTEFLKSTAIGDATNTRQSLLEVDPRDMNRDTWNRIIDCLERLADEVESDLKHAWDRKSV